jgi:hypothetical protein
MMDGTLLEADPEGSIVEGQRRYRARHRERGAEKAAGHPQSPYAKQGQFPRSLAGNEGPDEEQGGSSAEGPFDVEVAGLSL